MTISAIDSVLQQLHTTAAAAAGKTPFSAPKVTELDGGFAGELQKSLQRVNDAQQHSYKQAQAFELGQPDVTLNDVMVDLQKANIGFQMSLQVRNRLVAAYQDIMNMPV